MVHDDIGAVLADDAKPLVGAAAADHGQAACMRELHGRDSDTAGGAMYKYCLARPREGTLVERAIRRAVWNAKRRALAERDPRGKTMELRRYADGALGIRTGSSSGIADAGDVHAIARLEIPDVRADRLHLARAVL